MLKQKLQNRRGSLVLGRKQGESIEIKTPDGSRTVLTVGNVKRGGVRLHFAAPAAVQIRRAELEPLETDTERAA